MSTSYSAPLAKFALQRPVTVWMIFLAMLILGLAASKLLPLEKFPAIDIPQVVVEVPYPNATPAEVERLIVRPLEETLATITNIKEIRSFSNENGGFVVLNFDWQEDINARSIEVREKAEIARQHLPDDVERVFVRQFNTEDMPVLQLRISSERDLEFAWDLLNRNLKQPIERAQGVSKVELYGVNPRSIMIRLNPDALVASGLNTETVLATLRAQNFSQTAGFVETEANRLRISASSEYHDLEDIRALPITPFLTVNDIAEVSYELPRMQEGRHFNRSYAIGINVFKESTANLVDVSEQVVQVIQEAGESEEFQGIQLMMMDNTAESVTQSLSDLLLAGLIGAVLSTIVLYLFLRDWKLTLIIVLSVPSSLCLTLGVMYLLGYSLNILSIMGLMLAIGMLIDNAVVVSESVKQEQETAVAEGRVPNVETIEAGMGKVSLAIIAGTFTTAIVFLPNIFGEKEQITIFLEHVAIAICISLLASLLIAQTLIPLLLSKLKVNPGKVQIKRSRFKENYLASLRWSHRHPRLTTLFILLLLASTAYPLSQVGSDEAPIAYNNRLFINYDLDGQYALAEVEKEVDILEAYLYANKEAFELEDVYSYYTPGYAITTMLLKEERSVSVPEIQRRVRENLPPMSRSKPYFGFGGGENQGVQITLTGRSTERLEELSEELIPILANIEGLEDVQTDTGNSSDELRVIVNRVQAERYGLSTQNIAQQVSLALRGNPLRSFRHNPEGDVRIEAKYPDAYEFDLELLKAMIVKRDGAQLVRLDQVAHFERHPRLDQIRRFDRETTIRITANLRELELSDAREAIEQVMSNVNLPAGYAWSLDGGFRRQQQEQQLMLVNMLLAVCLVYMVMAALFESLLLPSAVIGSLLLAITGVFWGLMITSTGMEMMAMIGMLILMGIVVNNGIVLVDQINQLREEGMALEEAILEGSSRRIRPILMTVATTILGLLPLAFGSTQIGGDGPPYAPMAITIISGLIFSTITSLYFVPHAYSRLLFWRSHWSRVWQGSKRLRGKPQDASL
ncbi:MAG: RND type NFE family nodulation factor exporter system permease component [Idiomarinaceae bacterium HL-53]|nr:MAG: RND type NFE family nodulation factor exporter system permease component [Idiomarinaceae bacterium HL-53]CUS48843.1 hydrophobic/amphiphilic exporter-1, HAE1 family [Idiomarinaceae bacterium HL-53]